MVRVGVFLCDFNKVPFFLQNADICCIMYNEVMYYLEDERYEQYEKMFSGNVSRPDACV